MQIKFGVYCWACANLHLKELRETKYSEYAFIGRYDTLMQAQSVKRKHKISNGILHRPEIRKEVIQDG